MSYRKMTKSMENLEFLGIDELFLVHSDELSRADANFA
jgi:hypothetical protein